MMVINQQQWQWIMSMNVMYDDNNDDEFHGVAVVL